MINLHSFRKSGSSISAMCSVVGKNPGGGGGGGGVVKPTASLGPQEAKRLRRSDAEAERDPESDNGDLGSEGSSTKGDKGRHSIGSRTLAKQQTLQEFLEGIFCLHFQWCSVLRPLIYIGMLQLLSSN